MRHENHGLVRIVQLVDAFSDNSQRVNVEARICFVEHRKLWIKHGHLENLVALLLAAGEPFVDRTRHEAGIHLDDLRLLFQKVFEFQRIQFFLTVMFLLFVISEPQKLRVRDAGHLDRILKSHEDAFARAFIR